LIDGENYFSALHDAILNAKKQIIILSWDIDSRIRLKRGDETGEYDLGSVLCKALTNSPDLHVYILNWDWAVLYSLEREWLPHYKTQWKNQSRLHFELDGECPLAASQHQKLVVIDDSIAFCGGIDPGRDRWDTNAHQAHDPRRTNPDNTTYRPFHDLQWLVEGDIAAKLACLAKERWFRVTNEHLEVINDLAESPWPKAVIEDFLHVDINISLTFPAYEDYPAHHEVEQLYVDSIQAAKALIYIENQYLSSQSIMQALIKSLQQSDGPEIVIVLPKKTGGWLEQNTMDVLRARISKQIRAADEHHRLRICYPHQDSLGEEYISVHSKTTIIDDTFLRVGSSNLSNRSMGLDSECDLSIEAKTPAESEKIREIRTRLLCEHLGLSPDDLQALLEKNGKLTQLIDARVEEAHTLRPLSCDIDAFVDELVPQHQLIDPEKPVETEELIQMVVPVEAQKSFSKQWLGIASIISFLVIMTLVWRYSPMADMVTQDAISNFADDIQNLPLSGIMIIGFVGVASLLALPLTLLIVACSAAFGPWWGGFYALMGALAGALAGFGLGQSLGKTSIEKMTGSAISRLSKRMAKKGVLSVVTFRIIPVAPFTVINLIAGASHIRFRDFLIGTIIGLIPGVISLSIFADSLIKTIKNPTPEQVAISIAVIVGVILLTVGLKRVFKSKQ
jgi:phosphatidylserine/phosphatidylglycerophosphate/cardiolipin synthase-like enzyme/uncharacterized membrane protein YdjX (TVP38/TMEM64 family)